MNATWSDILSRLQESLPEGVFKVWLEPLQGELCAVTDDTNSGKDTTFPTSVWEIRLTAKNTFVANWVRDRLAQAIVQAGADILGSVPQLTVTTSDTPNQEAQPLFPAPLSLEELAKSLPSAPAVLASSGQLTLPLELPRVKHSSPLVIKAFKHSFDDFVVGPSNQLAHAAATNIMRTSTPVDILFMCSPSGLGKTHLAQAVGKAMHLEADQRQARMEYLTAEEFTTRFVLASRHGNMERFKEHFRNLDMLLLEDVHFLRGKDKTQEELLATIKVLHSKGGRVVLTSSFAPRDLSGVDSQLVSRFCSGFVASIERPDRDTRLEILMEKARRQSVILPQAIAELLADRITSDVRLLESSLHNLVLKSRLLGRPMNEQMAVEVLSSVAQYHSSLSLQEVVKLVCRSYKLTPNQLVSRSRKQELVAARNTAFVLLRKHTDLTLEEIGRAFNRRHSTVLKAITQVEQEISRQSPVGRQYLSTLRLIEKNSVRA